jgi:hypothetical protein
MPGRFSPTICLNHVEEVEQMIGAPNSHHASVVASNFIWANGSSGMTFH